MAENENRASPSSVAELDAFLAHLKAIDRDGNKRISAAEFMADIAAHLRGKDRAEIPKEYAQASDVTAAVRADIKAINDYETITARWNARDPAVTAQMWGKASEAQEAAQGRLGELLGYEPQYITTVLRENKSDLGALKNQQDAEREASADAKRVAAEDASAAQATQGLIESSVPKGAARDSVKGVTRRAPMTDEERLKTAVGQIPADSPELQDPNVRKLLGLPALAGTPAPAAKAPQTQAEAEMAASLAATDARKAAGVDPDILALRKQISAYSADNVEQPALTRESLGALDKVLGTLTPQATRGNGRTGQ